MQLPLAYGAKRLTVSMHLFFYELAFVKIDIRDEFKFDCSCILKAVDCEEAPLVQVIYHAMYHESY